MYEELLKVLRTCSKRDSCFWLGDTCPYMGNRLCDDKAGKAADAIEDLDNKLNLHRQGKISHWIPVAERLPENGSLIGNLICDSDGQIRIARQCAEIQLKEKTVYTDLIELADLLEEKCPASNWNDCTHVTHWMPLPEPPESGEA